MLPASRRKLEKLQLNLEDLNHEVAREVKSSRNAEKASSNFTAQLAEANRTIESERQLRTQAQVTLRTIQGTLDARDKELAELRAQMLSVLKTVDPDSVPAAKPMAAPIRISPRTSTWSARSRICSRTSASRLPRAPVPSSNSPSSGRRETTRPTGPAWRRSSINEAPFSGSPHPETKLQTPRAPVFEHLDAAEKIWQQ